MSQPVNFSLSTPSLPARDHRLAVWLYFRFPLSLRMVEEMVAARGVDVTYETIRRWAEKFGRDVSFCIRRRAPHRGDKWYMDEVVVSIAGRKHWLWRAVDQDGFVLDVLVQSRRDRKAARRLMRKLLRKTAQAPRVMITDKLPSYGAARKDMALKVEHRRHKRLNNRAENSHQPTRRRERIMKRFKSARQGSASCPFTINSLISSIFPVRNIRRQTLAALIARQRSRHGVKSRERRWRGMFRSLLKKEQQRCSP